MLVMMGPKEQTLSNHITDSVVLKGKVEYLDVYKDSRQRSMISSDFAHKLWLNGY